MPISLFLVRRTIPRENLDLDCNSICTAPLGLEGMHVVFQL